MGLSDNYNIWHQHSYFGQSDLSCSRFRQSLKTFLFRQWDHMQRSVKPIGGFRWRPSRLRSPFGDGLMPSSRYSWYVTMVLYNGDIVASLSFQTRENMVLRIFKVIATSVFLAALECT